MDVSPCRLHASRNDRAQDGGGVRGGGGGGTSLGAGRPLVVAGLLSVVVVMQHLEIKRSH